MDGTQTSEPTEAGPGSPGQATAYRRALDEKAATEGPLDLTIPLNIAEIRAALSTTGPHGGTRAPAPAAASASAASARPQEPRPGARHAGSRRLGRIAAFVALAAALSAGTAGALVLSNNASNPSVSLPASGAIPVAPSTGASPGGHAMGSGSTSAQATPSLSHSAADLDPVETDRTTSRAASASPSSTGGTGPSASASAAPSGSGPTGSISPPAPIGSTGTWQTLSQGQNANAQQVQETTSVQSLLNDIGYLQTWRHQTYVLPAYSQYAAAPDPDGYYGSATSDAIAQFQQNYHVTHTGEPGECDLATYRALTQLISPAPSGQATTQ